MSQHKSLKFFTQTVAYALCAAIIWQPAHAFVAQTPTVISTPPDVNIMFTLDDSGSMTEEYIPDSGDPGGSFISGTQSNNLNRRKISDATWRYARSAEGNPLHYNPRSRYFPWPTAASDRTSFLANANVAAVCVGDTGVINCGTTHNVRDRVVVNAPDNANQNDDTKGYWPATYFVYRGNAPFNAAPSGAFNTPSFTAPAPVPGAIVYGNAAHANNVQANWLKVEVRPTLPGSATATTYYKGPDRSDCTTATNYCTYAEELQNYANWQQYYRTRMLMAKGSVALAFSRQGENMRIGLGSINAAARSVDGVNTQTVRLGVRKFANHPTTAAEQYRRIFFESLYAIDTGSGTPLRRAADDVGKYFQRNDDNNPWAEVVGSGSKGTEYTCRRSFHILSTDGFWNGAASSSPGNNNNDNFSGNTPARPDGSVETYSNTAASKFGINPFTDGNSDTLADVAAYYWKTDLRPDMANQVKPSSRDPAFWQHLSMFTVGLGILGTGTVTPSITTQAQRDALIANKTAVAWTTPAANNAATGDDLIHASMNGRGRYFLATDPNGFANDLAKAINEASDQPAEVADLSGNKSSVTAGSRIYQATFSPAGWYGRLYAFDQNPTTGIINTDTSNPANYAWEASTQIPAASSRNIYTFKPSTAAGAAFTWTDLDATQQGYLSNTQDILSYLRGDTSKEARFGGVYRDRSFGLLGDIAGGTPVKLPDANFNYNLMANPATGASSYLTYRTALADIKDTLFAGANDGMLHAFNTANGAERFAYVPNAVFNVPRSNGSALAEAKLKLLSEPGYTHRFTVNGPPQIGEGYWDGAWHAVLFGSLGAGARAVYAWDVTDVSATAVSNSTSFRTKLLWEKSEADTDYADIGHVIGNPLIGRLKSGEWVAIFGNGYDSTAGKAVLYIADLKTGALLKKLEVEAGPGNGLSTPNMIIDADRNIVSAYAGDLKGNLWKFNLNGTNAAASTVAFSGTPLFVAKNASNEIQPITVQPELAAHPQGGAVVLFGTGKFFEDVDTLNNAANRQRQSIYGIWDPEVSPTAITTGRTALVAQTVVSSASIGTGFQGTSQNTIDWSTKRGWYLDLETYTSPDKPSERVSVNPIIFGKVILFTANSANGDPCGAGGTGRIMAFDPATGRAPSFPIFDTNSDGSVNNSDTFAPTTGTKAAINVIKLDSLGTQPMFQTTGANANTSLFDRGQTSTAGGVDLAKKAPNSDCVGILSVGQASTAVKQVKSNLCSAGGGRVSWRQLQ